MADSYVPLHVPFYDDGEFRVYDLSEGHFVATRINGSLHYRGTLKGCALWILRQQGR
jgi:hypothetical protein